MPYVRPGIGREEVKHILNIKRLLIAGVSSIAAFYVLPYMVSYLNLPSLLWLRVAIGGILAFIIAEVMW